MAKVNPFKGIRYNPERIASLADVVSPPYDVISASEQEILHGRSPYNVIRLELGLNQPGDDQLDNRYERAGKYLRAWLDEGILIPEDAPAFYLTATTFKTAGTPATRWGLLSCVKLEPFDQGGILPHERTYSGVKSERLSLMRACPANLSPIFSFFSDKASIIPYLATQVTQATPAVDFQDDNRHHHRMWVIKDPNLHRRIAASMEQQPFFIADGHHRYETALAYRDELASREGGLPEGHPANYTLMYLSSIQDPGLIIMPTHRLLPKIAPEIRHAFLERAGSIFELEPIETDGKRDRVEYVLQRLDRTGAGEGLAVMLRGVASPFLLQLKAGLKETIYPAGTPDMMKDLDVALLTEVVFPEFLGLSQTQLDDVNCVHYTHEARAAMEGVISGRYDMAFVIKPTPIASVQRIADAGMVMPRKSTYFAPKALTGLVMHAL